MHFHLILNGLKTNSSEVVHERIAGGENDKQEYTWVSRNHGLREAMYFIFQQALLCYAVLAAMGSSNSLLLKHPRLCVIKKQANVQPNTPTDAL